MKLDAPISYNGWTASLARLPGGAPSNGFTVDRFQPAPAEIDAYMEKRALQDGMDAADIYLGARRFVMVVTAFGTSLGDFWDKAQELTAAFHPTLAYNADPGAVGFLGLDFYQPTADVATWPTASYPNGIPLRYYMRPLAAPSFILERDRDGGVAAKGHSKSFDISLIARDPRKYLQDTTTMEMFTGSTRTVTYRGDYPSFPIVTWSQSAAGHSAFTIMVNALSTVINMSTKTSGSYVFSFSTGRFVDQTGASMWSLVTSHDGKIPVEVGTTHRLANRSGVVDNDVSFIYREAFA